MAKLTKNGKKNGRPKRVFTNGDRAILMILAAAGATDTEMCAAVSCARHTLYRAFADDPKLLHTIKKAKGQADGRAERSLYERVCGYDYTETTTEGGPKGRTIRVTEKHMAPDVAAAFIWLKNRQSDFWKDRHEIKHEGEVSFGDFVRFSESTDGKGEK